MDDPYGRIAKQNVPNERDLKLWRSDNIVDGQKIRGTSRCDTLKISTAEAITDEASLLTAVQMVQVDMKAESTKSDPGRLEHFDFMENYDNVDMANVELRQKQMVKSSKSLNNENFPTENHEYNGMFLPSSFLANFCQCLSMNWIFQPTYLQEECFISEVSRIERRAAVKAILSLLAVTIPDVAAASDDNSSNKGTESFLIEKRSLTSPIAVNQVDGFLSPTLLSQNFVCPMCWSAFSDDRGYFRCPNCATCLHNDCVVTWIDLQNHQECPCCEFELITDDMIVKFLKKQREHEGGQFRLWDIDELSTIDGESEDCGSGEVIFFHPDSQETSYSTSTFSSKLLEGST